MRNLSAHLIPGGEHRSHLFKLLLIPIKSEFLEGWGQDLLHVKKKKNPIAQKILVCSWDQEHLGLAFQPQLSLSEGLLFLFFSYLLFSFFLRKRKRWRG